MPRLSLTEIEKLSMELIAAESARYQAERERLEAALEELDSREEALHRRFLGLVGTRHGCEIPVTARTVCDQSGIALSWGDAGEQAPPA